MWEGGERVQALEGAKVFKFDAAMTVRILSTRMDMGPREED